MCILESSEVLVSYENEVPALLIATVNFSLLQLENMVDSLVTDAASMLSMSLNQGNIADDIESALNSIPNDTLNINVTGNWP